MRSTVLVVALLVGVMAAVCGPALGIALIGLSALGQSGATGGLLQVGTVALAVAGLSLGFGITLAWAAGRTLQSKPGRSLALPHWGWWLLAFLIALAAGQIVASIGATPLLPVFHILAGMLPAGFFLALAVSAGRVPARSTVGSLTWGGLGGVGLALVAEMILLALAAVAAMIWLTAADPALVERLQAWGLEMQSSGPPGDLSQFASLLTQPLVLLAVAIGVAVVAPLLEEGAKGLAVPLVALTGRRLSRLDGFIFGVAAGAGFAMLEGVLNGSLALTSANAWGGLMLVRGGAAAMHCLASGLVGLGWQAGLTERRWGRAIGLGLTGAAVHGAWNLAAVGMAAISTQAAAGGGSATGLWLLPVAGFMGLLWLAAVVALAVIPRRLAR